MLVSVTLSGIIYPRYNHVHQAMSELHAIGSPIEFIAPFLNHYPLAILFAGFGYYVADHFDSAAAKLSGFMIFLHGLATLTAGYFPCDLGCTPEDPSTSKILHGLSGLIILLTLLVAPAIWVFISKNILGKTWFGWLSLLAVIGQIIMVYPVTHSMNSGEYFGLYQRLSYSIPLIWLMVFSLILINSKKAP